MIYVFTLMKLAKEKNMGSNRRLFWGIVDKIEALIDSGIYSPGSRLPPERELAETFKVSRPTIREAIIALEVREKIEVKTGSGVYVLKPVNQLNGSHKQVNAFEVTQARALIEGEVAAIAATTITEDEHTAIYQALKSGDSTQARFAMHGHFNRLINALFDAVELRALEEIKQKNSEKRGLYSIPTSTEI